MLMLNASEVLGETQRKFQQGIEERQKQLQELRDAVKSHKRSAQAAVDDTERIFTQLTRSTERSRSQVIQLIRAQEEAAVSRAEGLFLRIEQEIDDLTSRNAGLEQLLHTDDHIHFLQMFQYIAALPVSTDSCSSTVRSLLSFHDVANSISRMKEQLEGFCKDIEKISDRDSCQLTLDSNTVNRFLCLSEENRVAAYTDTPQLYPAHPDRFDGCVQVLCRESVCGRCYWEVEWSGSDGVFIAVSYKSIGRKALFNQCIFGWNNKSCGLYCFPSRYSFMQNNIKSKIPVSSRSSRIGVYVDHSAGILSFYSVSDTMSLIHRIQTTFTEHLCPGVGFDVGSSVKLSSNNLDERLFIC